MATMKIKPDGESLETLIDRITAGEIKIPAFQRGFVWTQRQVIDLLDSIYRDFPIGSLLLWNSRERLRTTRNIGGFKLPDRDPEYPVDYVLDGQQRLSAIYGVFAMSKVIDMSEQKYQVDPAIFDIVFDLHTETFIAATEAAIPESTSIESLPLFRSKKHNSRYLRLDIMFAPSEYYEAMSRLEPTYTDLAKRLLKKLTTYTVPTVTIKDRTKDEVGSIFERINNTGTKLSTLDLLVAWTWSEDFHLQEKIEEILELLDEKGFGGIDPKRILQCLSAIIQDTIRTADILNLKSEPVRASIDDLRQSLERAIDFLSTALNVSSIDFLPHSHQLIPITYFFFHIKDPTYHQLLLLKRWFWATAFSRRYAGSTDLRVDEDIDAIKRMVAGDTSAIRRYEHSFNEVTLIAQDFNQGNPITRAFLLLLAQKGPTDLLKGGRIDVGEALSKFNQKEFHHIFPKDFLKRMGVKEYVNSVCNICFLTSRSNKQISNKSPSVYLLGQGLTLELLDSSSTYSTHPNLLELVMTTNLLPASVDIYTQNRFEEFLHKRAELVLNYLEQLMTITS